MRTCNTCGNPEDDHPYRHAFVASGDSSVAIPKKPKDDEKQAKAKAQGDLPLRLALLRAGVITPDQLEEAEKDVEAGGILFVSNTGRSDTGADSDRDRGGS